MNASEVEAVWTELESLPERSGTFFRRVRSHSPSDVLLGLRRPEDHPVLIIRIDRDALGALSQTESAGIHLEVEDGTDVAGPRDVALMIELRAPEYRDLFASLVADLIARLRPGMSDSEIVATLSTRLRRWQQLLRLRRSGLALEAQRGLFAELEMLVRLERSGLPLSVLVEGWTGPLGADRDLELPGSEVEVKGSASSRRNVPIASEYQLAADAGLGVYLAIIAVDETDEGTALGEQIDTVRAIATDKATRANLDQRLSDYGWSDEHRTHYERPLWTVVGANLYRVYGDFPRLDASELPAGVSNVTYTLDEGALHPYRLDWDQTLSDIAGRDD